MLSLLGDCVSYKLFECSVLTGNIPQHSSTVTPKQGFFAFAALFSMSLSVINGVFVSPNAKYISLFALVHSKDALVGYCVVTEVQILNHFCSLSLGNGDKNSDAITHLLLLMECPTLAV